MHRGVVATIALGLALACAAPAFAEKWAWFSVRGGAVAYDKDSLKADIKTGNVAANTVVYYEQPKSSAAGSYVFVAERLEFDCRGDRLRWSQSAVLDPNGGIVQARDDGRWAPLGQQQGSSRLFQRILCLNQQPPDQKEVSSLDGLFKAVQAGKVLTPVAPKVAAAPPPPVANPAPVKAAPQPASAAPPPVKVAAAPSPPSVQSPLQTAPKVELRRSVTPLGVETPARPAAPPSEPVKAIAAAPKASGPWPSYLAPPEPKGPVVDYAQAGQCVVFQPAATELSFRIVNSCGYPVTYAWCMANDRNPSSECGGPGIARGGGVVSARTQASTDYKGGVGRLHLFACRAPGAPKIKARGNGRYEFACPGPLKAVE